jgi:hypothetical protein
MFFLSDREPLLSNTVVGPTQIMSNSMPSTLSQSYELGTEVPSFGSEYEIISKVRDDGTVIQ